MLSNFVTHQEGEKRALVWRETWKALAGAAVIVEMQELWPLLVWDMHAQGND